MKLGGSDIFVKNVETMIRFYRGMLGFEIREDENYSNVFLEKDGTLFLFYSKGDFGSMTRKQFQYANQVNGHFGITLSVDDYKAVGETFKTVVAEGVIPVMTPTTESWGQYTCHMVDPEGDLMEIGSSVKGG